MSLEEKQPLLKEKQPLPEESDIAEYAKKKRSVRYFLVVPILIVYCVAVGMYYYVQSEWIQHFVKTSIFKNQSVNSSSGCGAANHSDANYIAYENVQETTARWQIYCTFASGIPGFLMTMILPSYSDSLGRRFLFIISTTCVTIKFSLSLATVYYKLDLIYLVAASAIDGMSGSFYTMLSATSSYLADITPSGAQRTMILTGMDCAVLICITLSGLGVGFLIQNEGFIIPFIICTGLGCVALVLTLFIPESRDKKLRANTMSLCGNVRRTVDFYASPSFKGKRCAYLLLLTVYFFEMISTSHRAGIEMLYQLGMPFCWTADSIGIFSAVRHAAQGFATLALVWPLKRCMSELTIATLSTVFNAGSYVLEAFAGTDLMLYLVAVPVTLSFLTVPMVKSIMSSMTSADKQGSLFASIMAVEGICGIVATFTMNTIYAYTVSIMNGFVFFVLAGIGGVVFLLLIVFAATQKVEKIKPVAEKVVNVEPSMPSDYVTGV